MYALYISYWHVFNMYRLNNLKVSNVVRSKDEIRIIFQGPNKISILRLKKNVKIKVESEAEQ